MSVIDFTAQAKLGSQVLPKRYDLEMFVGDDVEFIFDLTDGSNPLDLSGATGTVHIELITNVNLTSSPPEITISPDFEPESVQGRVVIPFTAANTVAMRDAAAPAYVEGLVWELEATGVFEPGKVRTLLGGKITLHEDIVDNEGP